MFTAIALGNASSDIPNATKTKLAASRLMAILQRKPPIDVSNTKGLKLVSSQLKWGSGSDAYTGFYKDEDGETMICD